MKREAQAAVERVEGISLDSLDKALNGEYNHIDPSLNLQSAQAKSGQSNHNPEEFEPVFLDEPSDRNIPRKSWRLSEEDGVEFYPGYRSQVSFVRDENNALKEVPYGTKGSIRPDYYNEKHSIDLKNYTLTTASGRSNLVRNITAQYNKRLPILPEGTIQEFTVDVRGQDVSRETLANLIKQIKKNTPDVVIKFY